MDCPQCHQDIKNNALKCKHCKQLTGATRDYAKDGVVCVLASFVFAVFSGYYSIVVNEIQSLRLAFDHVSVALLLFNAILFLVALPLAITGIKQRYFLWPVSVVAVLLLAASLFFIVPLLYRELP